MKTRDRQEKAIETRNITWRYLTEVGRPTRVKISFMCDAAKAQKRTVKNIDNGQTSKLRALQVTTQLAIKSKLMFEIFYLSLY